MVLQFLFFSSLMFNIKNYFSSLAYPPTIISCPQSSRQLSQINIPHQKIKAQWEKQLICPKLTREQNQQNMIIYKFKKSMNEEKDLSQSQKQQNVSSMLITDMKNLSSQVKPLSKPLYEQHNQLLNAILLNEQEQTPNLLLKLLTHTIHLTQYKNLSSSLLTLLAKVITCIKSISPSNNPQQTPTYNTILSHIIDIITLLNNQNKSPDITLRIIQTTYSLIDVILMKYFSVELLTRVFSICFDCCRAGGILENISISAVFALGECLFGFGVVEEGFQIMLFLLQYLLNGKKFMWIKQAGLKGLIWDLIIVSVKNFRSDHLVKLPHQTQMLELFNRMYKSCTNCIFTPNKSFYTVSDSLNKTTHHVNQTQINDYIRYFKAYTYLSLMLSLETQYLSSVEYVPFLETIPKLSLICELERNCRMYIFLESICKIVMYRYDICLSVEKGLVLMEIMGRISQELCLCNQSIVVNWEHNQFYIDKICHDEPRVSDGDFIRLIRNTTLYIRQKFEKDEDLKLGKKSSKEESARSSNGMVQSTSKKWEHFIRYLIRIVRYLSSLNYTNDDHEESPTRKLILELQYWFLICPYTKAKNMVLEELLITSTLLNNKMQAIKVSQCVQIGSNILYGYYEDLDSIGLTLIMKMMAGIRADWEEGKSFEELDEVYNLAMNLYVEEKLITNEKIFSITIQALVQCANGLLADLSQPKQKVFTRAPSLKRYYKMIDYILKKLIVVCTNNLNFTLNQWNFVSAFFISLCFNKSDDLKREAIDHIGRFVEEIFKNKEKSLNIKKEQDIMGLYLELAKAHVPIIEYEIVEQLKEIMPRIKEQIAIMDGFRIVKILSDSSSKRNINHKIHELQEILIKECLFGITDKKYLKLVLDGLQIKVAEKNQEYRLINLLWSISDHLRGLGEKGQVSYQEFIPLWDILVTNLWKICENSTESETKQSAIHTLTQILAEISGVLDLNFILALLEKYHQKMVLLLLGILANSHIQEQKRPETAKISIKNHIKIFKKLLSISKEEAILSLFHDTNNKIIEFVHQGREQKQEKLTAEFVYELQSLVLQIVEDESFKGKGIIQGMKQLFITLEEYIKACENRPDSFCIDVNSHMFKKKLKPYIEKVGDKLYAHTDLQSTA